MTRDLQAPSIPTLNMFEEFTWDQYVCACVCDHTHIDLPNLHNDIPEDMCSYHPKSYRKKLNLEGYNRCQEKEMGAPPQAPPRERLFRKHGDCLASCQEANHAAGVQRADFCPDPASPPLREHALPLHKSLPNLPFIYQMFPHPRLGSYGLATSSKPLLLPYLSPSSLMHS